MRMHQKFYEKVQICCDNFQKEKNKEMAAMLTRFRGSIVVNVHNSKKITWPRWFWNYSLIKELPYRDSPHNHPDSSPNNLSIFLSLISKPWGTSRSWVRLRWRNVNMCARLWSVMLHGVMWTRSCWNWATLLWHIPAIPTKTCSATIFLSPVATHGHIT